MANYKGHIVGGVIITGAYAGMVALTPVERFVETANVLQNWQAIAAVFVVGILFALFPDVDTNSKAQDVFFGIIFPIDVILLATGYIQAAAYLGLIAMLPILGHHRGWTHKLWAMFVIPLPILLLPYLYNDAILPASIIFYGAAVVGYFSHLLLDGLIISSFRIKN
jgi:membrane-bound metal-dependent hydrolase YbcI (DUF457 family)